MPIHEDDPTRADNLTDAVYNAELEERSKTGNLHVIPQHYLDAAELRLSALGDGDYGPQVARALGNPITYVATGWLTSYGPFSAGRPWARVLHSLECNPNPGIARELSAPGGYLDNEGLAPHGMTDPTQRVRACSTQRYSGHVGGRANPLVVGYEVAGRAGNSRAQWLDGGNQQRALESDAMLIAWDYVQDGWSRAEIRMLSGAQIKQNYNGGPIVRGLITHNDVSQFIGGTNHWDPGPNFPFDWFLDRVRSYYDQFKGGSAPSTADPAKPPTPAIEEDHDMGQLINAEGSTYVIGPGYFRHLTSPDDVRQGQASGIFSKETKTVTWDQANAMRSHALRPITTMRPRKTTTSTTQDYTILPTDKSLTAIAAKFQTTWQHLQQLNPVRLANPDVIEAGWVIKVPKA